jgi:hypothetical protein
MKNFERLGVLGFRFLKAAIMFVNHTDVHNTYVEPVSAFEWRGGRK